MAVLNKNNVEEIIKYKDFIFNNENTSLLQSMEWAEVKDDWDSEYVYLEEDGEIVAALSILIKNIPGGYSLMYASRGPVCDFNDISLVKRLIDEVKPLAKKYKAIMLKMDPEVRYSDALTKKYEDNGFKVKNRQAEIEDLIQPRNNMIVYFEDNDAESIMMKFSSRNRNKIRSAGRKGVYTNWDNSDEFIDSFYELYTFMAKRNKISHRDKNYFYKMRDAFEDKFRVYLVYHEDDILSGGITINYNGKLYYLYGGSNNTKRNMYPNDFMNFEMMRWGLETKGKQYDMGGVLNMDENDGLYRFKKPFCKKDGVTEYIGEVDYVYNKPLYYIYNNIVPKFQKFKKKIARR